ncbi:MAG: protein kinase [Verrucomicrobiota bacterium]
MSDRYQIQEKIGQGGLGAVYRAFDSQLKREVALKRILTPEQANKEDVEEAAQKLMKEATVMSSLNHPNIVTVFDIGQDESGGFVVMELLDGETLDETVGRGLLTLNDFSEVVNQTLEALIAAQSVNMLHRDLKPGNVMVIWRASGKFQIKVLDFGLAKISDAPSVQTIDQGDAILGSIYFMAPEQFERLKLDFRTDLYAMGAIYYFSLTGKYPFDGESAPQVMAAHLQHKVKPLKEVRPDLPDDVCQWVMWLINRDMKRRPADAREALERFPPVAATSSGPVYVAPEEEIAEAILVPEEPSNQGVNPATGQLQVGGSPRVMKTGPQPTTKRSTGPQTGPHQTGGVTSATSSTGAISSHSATVELKYQEEARKKRRGMIIGTVVSLTIIILLGAFFLLGKLAEADKAKRMANLADTARGNAEDVGLIVHFLDPDHSDPRALRVLKELEGPGVYDAILQALTNAAPGRVRMYIMDTVASRNMPEAYSDVSRIFSTSPDPKERSLAAKTIRIIARDEHLDSLLEHLQKPGIASADRELLERAAIMILRKNADVEKRTSPILNAMNSSTGDHRKSLCRILGALGGKAAEARIARIFKEEDPAYQGDAILALNYWPDKSAHKLLSETIQNSNNAALKTAATRAYIRMLGLPNQKPVDTNGWKLALDAASNSDKQRVFGLMVDRPLPATVNFLKNTKLAGMDSIQKQLIDQLEKSIASMPTLKSGQLLKASDGEIRGESNGGYINRASGIFEGWASPSTWIQWEVKIPEPGTYTVEVSLSCDASPGSGFAVLCAGKQLFGKTQRTGAWDDFKFVKVGNNPEITFDAKSVGPQMIFLKAGRVVQPRIADIQGIRLTKK